jgi:hypothetical protein
MSKNKKILSEFDLIKHSIKDFKKDNEEWKSLDSDDLYGIESYIDGLLYEKKYAHLAPGYGSGNGKDELILERLTFSAIKQMKGKRHGCDPYYDDAFGGRDE